jgi:hypothetical protein
MGEAGAIDETAAAELLNRVAALVTGLRAAGFDVPTAGHLDAVAALQHIGLDDVATVRAALRATLLKEPDPERTFDRLFAHVLLPPAGYGDGAGAGAADLAEQLRAALERGVDDDLDRLAAQAVDALAGLDVAGRSDRYHLQRTTRALDLSDLYGSLLRKLRRDGGRDDFELSLQRAELSRMLDQFKKRLAREIAARRAEQEHDPPGSLRDRNVAELSATELAALRDVVRPLARLLAARAARHRRQRTSGRLDARRTIRRSLQAGGVPLDVVHRARHPHRPDLVVLCDVSGSVADYAQFTFMLVSALHDELRSVRSFAFVDGVAEVTDVFAEARYAISVHRLIERRGVVALHGHSDYGAAFHTFATNHLATITPRSTVLVVGDARTNYRDAGTAALRQIAERSRRLYWLNPEPEAEWGEGDSMIDAYRPWCSAVHEVRTLNQLAAAIGALL